MDAHTTLSFSCIHIDWGAPLASYDANERIRQQQENNSL